MSEPRAPESTPLPLAELIGETASTSENALRRWRAFSPSAAKWLTLGSHLLIAALAVYYVALFLWIALARATFPFDIEWMEGGMVSHVRVIAERGHPYHEPSVEFAPFIYNPLYYYLALLTSWVFGFDYFALRLISIIAWLGVLVLTFEWVRRETQSCLGGALASGLLAACYALSDGWPDLARVDSLLLALMLLSTVLVRFARSRHALMWAGGVLFLAFATKQVALGILPSLALYLWLYRGPRACLQFTAACLVPAALFVMLLTAVSDGWYWYFAFVVPASHEHTFSLDVWRDQALGPLAFTLPFVFYYFILPARSTQEREARSFNTLMAAALIGIAVFARAHAGSWRNDNLTAYIALVVLCGLGATPLLQSGARNPQPRLLASAAVVFQFWLLDYSPARWIPTAAAHTQAQQLITEIAAFKGDVYLPHHPHASVQAGKRAFAHEMALVDIKHATSDFRNIQSTLPDKFRQAVNERRFDAVILDRKCWAYLKPAVLNKAYKKTPSKILKRGTALTMRSGVDFRPQLLYRPTPKRSNPKARPKRKVL